MINQNREEKESLQRELIKTGELLKLLSEESLSKQRELEEKLTGLEKEKAEMKTKMKQLRARDKEGKRQREELLKTKLQMINVRKDEMRKLNLLLDVVQPNDTYSSYLDSSREIKHSARDSRRDTTL